MALEPKHVVRLFTRMQHLYAHRWTTVYGTSPLDGDELSVSAKQWMFDLRDYSPEQIAFGMNAVMAKRIEWPPGPIEFADLCEGVPSVAEIMDRDNDHGPVCYAIRKRLDWYTIEGLSSMKAVEYVKTNRERVLVAIRKDGTMQAIQQFHREALAQAAPVREAVR